MPIDCARHQPAEETTIEATVELHDRRAGDIAAPTSRASVGFRRFDSEFCCQGRALLSNAVNRRNLDLDDLKAALDALDPTAAPKIPQETGGLIDHLQTRFQF